MRVVSRFDIGDVIKAGLSTYWKNLPNAIVLAAIGVTPLIVFLAFAFAWVLGDDTGAGSVFWSGFAAYAFVLCFYLFWIEAGMTFVVVRTLRSGPPGLGETLAFTVRALPRVSVVGLLCLVFVTLGTLVLIVPGILLWLALWVRVPVAAVERIGVWQCVKRTHELTKGAKGRIFGIDLLIYGASYLVSVLAGAASMAIGWAFGWSLEEALLSETNLAVFGVVVIAFSAAVYWSVRAAVVAVSYHDLRVIKDGADTGQIAKVFD